MSFLEACVAGFRRLLDDARCLRSRDRDVASAAPGAGRVNRAALATLARWDCRAGVATVAAGAVLSTAVSTMGVNDAGALSDQLQLGVDDYGATLAARASVPDDTAVAALDHA